MDTFDTRGFVLMERVKSKRNPSLRYEIKRSILTKPFSPKKKPDMLCQRQQIHLRAN